jgi:hypothetical protein
MIKAGSLFYAIVISIIIAITSSAIILSEYITKIEAENLYLTNRLQLNAESGYNLLLSKQAIISDNQSKIIDLYNNGTDSVLLCLKKWGAYEIAISKAIHGSKHTLCIGQTGFYTDSADAYSLYLADEDKPLALCGKTSIKGTAFLPKAGVKRAYIEGESFIGTDLIEGTVKESKKTLPDFNKSVLESLKSAFSKKMFADNDSIVLLENGISDDTLINSFNNNTIVFNSTKSLNLISGIYQGNVAFFSDTQIDIFPGIQLNDIIIIAPQIHIHSGFRGNIQSFATDSIVVEEKVTLFYPSALGIIKAENSKAPSHIIISKLDTIAGSVFIYKGITTTKPAAIHIAEQACIIGEIYSNAQIDIKGELKGSLMCKNIVLKTASSVYENHLLNATINVLKRPKQYVGINLTEEAKTKKTVKWLY